MDSPFLGTICVFGFNFAPYGWAFCNGQILSISQNAALFSLLGTVYGGNGTTTFALPDLQGRAAIHMGQLQGGSLYTIGEAAGAESATMTVANMPAHAHSLTMNINANSRGNSTDSPVGAFPGIAANTVNNYNSSATNNVFMKPANVTLAASGGNIPIAISDPSQVLNYSIALQGMFPSRN